jgi:hypothetical protein
MKKTVKLVKKMKFSHNAEYTYPGLVRWYHTMFEKLGWMLLAKEHNFDDKIVAYKNSIRHLKEGIIKKHKEMEDHDKRRDLEIMLHNVEILIKHADHDFA